MTGFTRLMIEQTKRSVRSVSRTVEARPGRSASRGCFAGPRVPVSALFENLKDGATVEQFLEWFPGVKEWQVAAALKHEADHLKAPVQS